MFDALEGFNPREERRLRNYSQGRSTIRCLAGRQIGDIFAHTLTLATEDFFKIRRDTGNKGGRNTQSVPLGAKAAAHPKPAQDCLAHNRLQQPAPAGAIPQYFLFSQ